MQVLIIEDEPPAADRLKEMILSYDPDIEIVGTLDSVDSAVKWFEKHTHPQLVFMDIQLADGISFEIFDKVELKCPVIFTTAYDQYAVKAFKVNSLDYLLKPIEAEELANAFQKHKNTQSSTPPIDIASMMAALKPKGQERFMVKVGEQFKYILTENIRFFMAEAGMVLLVTHSGQQLPVDFNLDQIEQRLNPRQFFRINRKFLVRLESIQKIHTYFNSRLKLELQPAPDKEVIVSRERVSAFKNWLNS